MLVSNKYFQEAVEFVEKTKALEKHGEVKAVENKVTSGQFSGTFSQECGLFNPYHSSMLVFSRGPSGVIH